MTEYVEVARADSERGEVVLRRRSEERAADALELRVNGVFVMDTKETTSEIALADAALELVEDPRDVVVAGLGLGFTVQRVLADPRVEQVKVVEIEEALVGWMRDGTVPHGPALLADRRVHVVNADIRTAVAEATSTYDLVLLDVDNGPGFLVHDGERGGLRTRLPRQHQADPQPWRGARGLVGESRRPSSRQRWRTCSAAAPSTGTTCCCRSGPSSTCSTSRAA